MTDWWEALGDQSRDREKAERLANVLSKLPGTRDQKIDWLEKTMPLLEAEADRVEDPANTRAYSGTMRSLAIRYYRGYLRRRGTGSAEKPQEPRGKGQRSAEVVRLREVLKP